MILAAAQFVHYIPIATTLLSAVFLAVMVRHYLVRNRGWHILWWALGILTYGLGTALEGSITLFGNSVGLTKAWYIAGALLGGYPLAQGSVYLHLRKAVAHWLTAITFTLIAALSVCVVLSPANVELLQPHRPSGSVLGWQWIRLFTPFINLYAVVFLIGGAIWSAWKYARARTAANRAVGNTLIAIGAILPGIGGAMAKADIVEALYVGEFLGIILIWIGYRYCLRPTRAEAEPAMSVVPA